MPYEKPEHSREEVNRAGKLWVSWENTKPKELFRAMRIIDNWRAAHAYPTQIIFTTLKRHAQKTHTNALVAQRIKRLPSIVSKLNREKTMRLSQMQDIGGCRVILENIQQVYMFQKRIEHIRWNHEKLQGKNYIEYPKDSGYRGIHLRYRYRGEKTKSAYNDLMVEIQIRTKPQHI